MHRFLLPSFVVLAWALVTADVALAKTAAREFHVSRQGDDTNPGTAARPFATLAQAQRAARAAQGGAVVIHAGTYYLPDTLRLAPEDSHTEYRAAPEEHVVLTCDRRLTLAWKPFRDGIWQADLGPPADAASRATRIDQLFVNGQPQRLARYPNFDPTIRPFGGFAADAIGRERAARWKNPTDGYLHALHPGAWGGVHFRITGKSPAGDVTTEGGWQNNRGSGLHAQHRFVENIFEELDAPGEFYHDVASNTLYFLPPEKLDLAGALCETPTVGCLLRIVGTRERPVKNVVFRGLTLRHAARTFMRTREPLLRSDWTIARDAALFLEGTEDCQVLDCEIDQAGGNAIFASNYNRRVRIAGCDIHDSGASAVALVGDPRAVRNPLYEYGQRQSLADIDRTPGPKTDDYPSDCVVEDCLLRGIGLVEKQAAGVQIAMAARITVRNCSIYDASRAGINIGDGCWGGHLIEHCDVFDTVQETGDHGSFNSWGRDRYWELKGASAESLPELARLDAVQTTILRHNRWRCDHGWDVDLDDGSSNYEISHNVFLRGGLKLREGFHRTVFNNVGVDCGFHPHVWYHVKGQGISNDSVTKNIWAGAHAPAIMPSGKWGREVDYNLFTTSDADRLRFAANDCDAHSRTGDPRFVDRAAGDYRVRPDSPALLLGFENFATDPFGVRKPELRKIAKTPRLPGEAPPPRPSPPHVKRAIEHPWLGAVVRGISGDEFSAFGVPKEAGGVHLKAVPPESLAGRQGFRTDDLIQSIDGAPVKSVADLLRRQNAAAGQPLDVRFVRAQTPKQLTVARYFYVVVENAAGEGFRKIPVAAPGDVAAIDAVTMQPATNNEPPRTLADGRLAANYGPVFGNGVEGGIYKVDLGRRRTLETVNTWSFQQNGNRGPQRFVLFGSASDADPGWSTNDRTRYVPIAEVDATDATAEPYQATSLRAAGGESLGEFRWLAWQVYSVTPIGENTAFQEVQVIAK